VTGHKVLIVTDVYTALHSQRKARNIAVFGGLRAFEVFRSQLFLQQVRTI